jgi:ABC-type transport system involved in multi-copper enzyme maturation permease subunit
MGAVYLLTLRQLAGRWRLAIMTLLAAMPVFITVVMLDSPSAPQARDFETAVLGTILAGAITPLVVLAIAAAAFANEIEDKTLANLTLSPLPRWHIVIAKLLATITISAPFISASAFATSHIAFLGDAAATIAVTVSALVAVALYSAAFVWLGLAAPQAVGVGLLYIVLWEGFFSGFVSGVRLLSIRHHAIALMHGLDDRRFAAGDHLELGVTAATSVLVFAGFALLAVRRLQRMDVP